MFDFTNLLLSDATGDEKGGGASNVIIFVVIGLIVLVAIVMLVVSNVNRRKQIKESEKQKSSLQPGDLVETVGGIIGKIVVIRPSSAGGTEFVIETGEPDRATTLTVDMQALYRVLTHVNAPVPEEQKPAVSKPDVEGITSASCECNTGTNGQAKKKK